jgi:hypothetical protein
LIIRIADLQKRRVRGLTKLHNDAVPDVPRDREIARDNLLLCLHNLYASRTEVDERLSLNHLR